jgi:hypothetical protein
MDREERIRDLISKMTLEEKVSQLLYDAPAVESAGIPKYNWWNECLHGVARVGLVKALSRKKLSTPPWPGSSAPVSSWRSSIPLNRTLTGTWAARW